MRGFAGIRLLVAGPRLATSQTYRSVNSLTGQNATAMPKGIPAVSFSFFHLEEIRAGAPGGYV
jgi:hypothetical protein